MNKLLMFLLLLTAFGCNSSDLDHKQVLLDSLKREYAGKEIHLTFANNEAGTESLLTQYAYIDSKKSEPAFELNREQVYKLAAEEGMPYVPTSDHPQRQGNDMVLIEIPNTAKRGYVSYKMIKELKDVSLYDKQ
jgi:hypothetical protein